MSDLAMKLWYAVLACCMFGAGYIAGHVSPKVQLPHDLLTCTTPSKTTVGAIDCVAQVGSDIMEWPSDHGVCFGTSGPNSPIIQGNQGSISINGEQK